MANNIEAMHNDATVICPDSSVKLEPETQVGANPIRVKLVPKKEKDVLPIAEHPIKLEAPEGLDHYLFW